MGITLGSYSSLCLFSGYSAQQHIYRRSFHYQWYTIPYLYHVMQCICSSDSIGLHRIHYPTYITRKLVALGILYGYVCATLPGQEEFTRLLSQESVIVGECCLYGSNLTRFVIKWKHFVVRFLHRQHTSYRRRTMQCSLSNATKTGMVMRPRCHPPLSPAVLCCPQCR